MKGRFTGADSGIENKTEKGGNTEELGISQRKERMDNGRQKFYDG